MRTATAITLVTTMGLAASPALSQDAVNRTDSGTVAAPGANSAASNEAPTRNRDVVSLPDWHPDVSGANVQSVEDLIDNDVLGANGEDIGDVENVMFDEIIPKVVAGQYDAGLIIHEGQITYENQGLELVVDLGKWWTDSRGLPLPLGGNCIRRDVGGGDPKEIGKVCRILLDSIEFALTHREEAVKFARKHDLIVLSDLAYNEIYFDEPTPSILQVDGAKDIAVEFTTMSKTYSMAGWRIGFVAGNEKLVGALGRVKSYLDYGAYTPIQVAAAAALDGPQDCVDEFRQIYRSRRDVLVESFTRAGWPIPSPKASMFAWAPIPEPLKEMGSLEFSLQLINEAHVAVAPGAGFGEQGDGHVRIALVENEQRIRQAARNIRKFLQSRGIKDIQPAAAE